MGPSPTVAVPASVRRGTPELRPPTASDASRIAAICRDQAIQRFTRIPAPYTEDDARDFIAMATAEAATGAGVHLLTVEQGQVIGCVGVDIDPFDLNGTVGYWTAEEVRGRGLTRRAVDRLCTWLLDSGYVRRLELHTAATNVASNAVAAAAGFVHEGTRRSAMRLGAVDGQQEDRVDGLIWGRLPTTDAF